MATAPHRPTWHRLALLALLIMTLIAGVIAVRIGSQHQPAVHPSATEAPTTETLPASDVTDRSESTDVGQVEDDHEGESRAVAAAVSYATASQQWLYFTDEEIRSAVSEIATPMARTQMAEEVIQDVSLARDQLAQSEGRVWWLVRPLAWRVEHHDPDRARVSVWVVTVLSASGVAAPQCEFMTVTMDLARQGDTWLVDRIIDKPGPTPMTGPRDQPWDAEPFDTALDGYTRIPGEPVR